MLCSHVVRLDGRDRLQSYKMIEIGLLFSNPNNMTAIKTLCLLLLLFAFNVQEAYSLTVRTATKSSKRAFPLDGKATAPMTANMASDICPMPVTRPNGRFAFVGAVVGRWASGALYRICVLDSSTEPKQRATFPVKLLHGMLLMGLVEIMIPDDIAEALENVVGEE